MIDRSELHFDAVMGVKYHRRRAAFLERVSAMMSAAILFGGAGAFASLFGNQTLIAKALAALVAMIGIIQIVFQTDRCAVEHRNWLRRFLALQKSIDATPTPTGEQISQWNDLKLEIESECVGEFRALQKDCYNRTVTMLDLDGQPIPLKWRHLWFMQIYSFENSFQRRR